MSVEAAIAIASGIAAGSLVLTAFGLDSLIELASGGVLMWRLSVELRHGQGKPGVHAMDSNFRHHRASRDGPVVVLVPIPVGGSPESIRQTKPRYPRQDRPPPWRPQRAIPTKRGKAAALQRLIDYFQRQDEIVREFMRPDAAMLKSWLATGRL
jgi:hypothetical protein